MTKVRLFKDLEKMLKSSIRICFFFESVWSKFSFFSFSNFSRFFGIELKRRHLGIRKSSSINKFKNLWIWIQHAYVVAPKCFYHGIYRRNFRKVIMKWPFFYNFLVKLSLYNTITWSIPLDPKHSVLMRLHCIYIYIIGVLFFDHCIFHGVKLEWF